MPSLTTPPPASALPRPSAGENFYVDAKGARKKKLLTGGKAVRDRDGKIVEAAAFQKGEDEAPNGRVQADRRWFGASPALLPPSSAREARVLT